MTDPSPAARWSSEPMRRRLRRRHLAERLFQRLGVAAVGVALLALATLLGSIVGNGYTAFLRTRVALEVFFDPEVIGALAELPPAQRQAHASDVDWAALVRGALAREFPDVSGRSDLRALQGLVSTGARSVLRDRVLADPGLVGRTATVWVPSSSEVDALEKGQLRRDPEVEGARLSAQQLAWIAALE